MKKLEELGISPTPWRMRETTGGVSSMSPYIIRDATGYILRCGQINNAHLITAAPKMYEALREAITESCIRYCGESPIHCPKKQGDCFVQKWRAALAKASGESEVAK